MRSAQFNKLKDTFKPAQTSAVLYKKLIEHMNEAVWMGDKYERTVYANPKFCELMEYSVEEMLGRESYEFWDEESANRVRNVNVNHRAKGISSSYEGNLLTKSGKKIPVLLSGTPLPDGGTIGIMTDLRDLKKKESMYEKLIQHMNEALWVGDKNERTVYANPKFCDLVGYSLEEIIGKESYVFWDQESADKVRNVNTNHRAKGISSSYEGNLLAKNGEKIPVLCSGTPLPDGGTYGIHTDLRELKKKEETEKMLNRAIEYSNDAIIIFDDKGQIQSWNNGAKIIFGYKKTEAKSEGLEKIFSKKDFGKILNQSNILYNVELKGLHKNKNRIRVSATLTPIFDKTKEKMLFCLLIARDITNQSKFEEELALKYQKMREAYNRFGILRRQMDYVFDLLEICNSSTNTKTIADFIVSSIIMLTQVDACVLRLFNTKKKTLDLLSCFGVADDWQGKSTIKYEKSLVQKAFEKKMPLKIIDLTKEPKYQSKYLAKKNNLSSMLLIPLVYKGKLSGSLSLYVNPQKKLKIFENEFMEKYSRLIEMIMGGCLAKV